MLLQFGLNGFSYNRLCVVIVFQKVRGDVFADFSIVKTSIGVFFDNAHISAASIVL